VELLEKIYNYVQMQSGLFTLSSTFVRIVKLKQNLFRYLKGELAVCLCVSLNGYTITIYEELLKPVAFYFFMVTPCIKQC